MGGRLSRVPLGDLPLFLPRSRGLAVMVAVMGGRLSWVLAPFLPRSRGLAVMGGSLSCVLVGDLVLAVLSTPWSPPMRPRSRLSARGLAPRTLARGFTAPASMIFVLWRCSLPWRELGWASSSTSQPSCSWKWPASKSDSQTSCFSLIVTCFLKTGLCAGTTSTSLAPPPSDFFFPILLSPQFFTFTGALFMSSRVSKATDMPRLRE
mmetsp:Transcript_74342/g.160761  ORF Transcript_74342/g.160761 Transcript_74342/m.160761 type:complete len:207 (+) Transcript_74342:561-1181(+)